MNYNSKMWNNWEKKSQKRRGNVGGIVTSGGIMERRKYKTFSISSFVLFTSKSFLFIWLPIMDNNVKTLITISFQTLKLLSVKTLWRNN